MDKTVNFVGQSGSAYEAILLDSEENNPKFSFLKEKDLYRPYYDQKLREYSKSKEKMMESSSVPMENQGMSMDEQDAVNMRMLHMQHTPNILMKKELKPPPPDQFSVPAPPIPALDMYLTI